MIVPFTRAGFYYEAIKAEGTRWRILVRVVNGVDFLFDSAIYPEDVCKAVVDVMNSELIERKGKQ